MTALLTDPDLYLKMARMLEIHMEMGRHLSGLFKLLSIIMASVDSVSEFMEGDDLEMKKGII